MFLMNSSLLGFAAFFVMDVAREMEGLRGSGKFFTPFLRKNQGKHWEVNCVDIWPICFRTPNVRHWFPSTLMIVEPGVQSSGKARAHQLCLSTITVKQPKSHQSDGFMQRMATTIYLFKISECGLSPAKQPNRRRRWSIMFMAKDVKKWNNIYRNYHYIMKVCFFLLYEYIT